MLYTSPKNLNHNRSFSFENWENKDGKSQAKFYYNYKAKPDDYKNQYRGDMPTFGDSELEFRNKYKQNRKGSSYSNFDSQLRDRREFQSRTNYSDEKWSKKQSAEPRPRDLEYGGRVPRKDESYSGNNYRIEESSNSAYQQRRQSRIQFERSTEQKLTNIDKINQKIKKILNTLNQEEKKITQHHLKVGNKKIANQTYANRIKTQGDDSFQDRRQKQNDSIYGKLVGLRDRYQNQFDSSQGPSALREIKGVDNFEFTQKVSLGERHGNYQQSWRKEENYFSKWSRDGHDKQLKSRFLDDKYNQKSKQYPKTDNQKPYQLLKGTNVKSTDSLNLSTSICLKNEKENEARDYGNKKQRNQQYGYRNTSYQSSAKNDYKSASKFTTFQAPEQMVSNKEKKSAAFIQNQKNDSREEEFTKIQKSNQRWMNTIEKDQEESPTFTSFGEHKRTENTPAKRNLEKSLSRYEKSNKSCKLSNGKDLDEEIEKIQKKINNCENIKKQLNVEEDQQIKKSRLELKKSLSKYKEAKSSADQKSKGWQRNMNDSRQKIAKFGSRNNTFVAEFKAEQSFEQKFNQAEKQCNKGKINEEISEGEVSLPKPFKMSSKKTTKRAINSSEVKEIESAFMSEDRENRQQECLKNLISRLCKQIELDTSFRNSKKWFNRKPNPSKWADLGRELMLRKIGTTEQQNRQIFTMTEEEDNPFHTEREDEGSYTELINNFLKSEKHWIDNLQHKFVREEIGCYLQEMDIDKKGNITIEDMVRYINLQSDKYYRNRDLSLVFRRLSGARGQVIMEYILAQFCH